MLQDPRRDDNDGGNNINDNARLRATGRAARNVRPPTPEKLAKSTQNKHFMHLCVTLRLLTSKTGSSRKMKKKANTALAEHFTSKPFVLTCLPTNNC
jgi:hypothetical protein